jgi:hypothetical protein
VSVCVDDGEHACVCRTEVQGGWCGVERKCGSESEYAVRVRVRGTECVKGGREEGRRKRWMEELPDACLRVVSRPCCRRGHAAAASRSEAEEVLICAVDER